VKRAGRKTCSVPSFSILAINLAGSTERWASLSGRLAQFAPGIPVTRIEAVDGRIVAPEEREGFDKAEFERRNGRICLGGEYGCYRSHLKVYAAAAEGEAGIYAVFEDDVMIMPDSLARIEAVLPVIEALGPDSPVVVRLVRHRSKLFRSHARTALGDRIGRMLHGPSGSSAAYLMTRAAARSLAREIAIMREPLDVALEAGWRSDLVFLETQHNIVGLGGAAQPSTIGTYQGMRTTKFPKWRRLPCYAHRTAEYVRRALYALRPIG
jgi:glycosyl transferase, family 25